MSKTAASKDTKKIGDEKRPSTEVSGSETQQDELSTSSGKEESKGAKEEFKGKEESNVDKD